MLFINPQGKNAWKCCAFINVYVYRLLEGVIEFVFNFFSNKITKMKFTCFLNRLKNFKSTLRKQKKIILFSCFNTQMLLVV